MNPPSPLQPTPAGPNVGPPPGAPGAPGEPATPTQLLGGIHTSSFPQILDLLGVSLAVTTYQANMLVLLRPQPQPGGALLNTHFRVFSKPMGLAWEHPRLAMGTENEVWEFHDMPALARQLDPPDSPTRHDAALLPRNYHVTGNVYIHEMAWASLPRAARPDGTPEPPRPSELYFINTRFSCLATRGTLCNFVPCWKPSFISALAPEDRCHLNGLALRDGQPRYVTALGETNAPAGWRDNKRNGGILIDLANNQIMTRGLSMPHSPRWHEGRLWVLESGNGGVGIIDPRTGRYQEVCRLPGFTRGFSFAGPYAFVGLSQVRETAVFSGLPITETPQDQRFCGVWAIDTRTGQIAGSVRFTDKLKEIFAVQTLPKMRWPDVLSDDKERIADSFELPDQTFFPLRPTEPQKPGVS